MRNLTDEQAAAVAVELVEDHLREGIEFGDIAEALGDLDDPDGIEDTAEEDDVRAVDGQVRVLLDRLLATLREDY